MKKTQKTLQSFTIASKPENAARHLPLIRKQFEKLGIDGLIIPHDDEYLNEYLPACNERLAWVTGFAGSAGTALVLKESAHLFVDGRYILDAPKQTDTSLFNVCLSPPATVAETIKKLATNQRWKIGYSPWLHSPQAIEDMLEVLKQTAVELVALEPFPVDELWQDRPTRPAAPIKPHTMSYAGKSHNEKLDQLRTTMKEKGAHWLVLTATDSIAWLFNLRGADVKHMPIALAYALVPLEGKAILCVDQGTVTPALESQLADDVEFNHEAFSQVLKQVASKGEKVWYDRDRSPSALPQIFSTHQCPTYCEPDPCRLPKACKNDVEIEGMQRAQAIDALAMVRFLSWFDEHSPTGKLDEIAVATKLEECRRQSPDLVDISFDTIAAYGPHGAISHYRVSHESSLAILPGSTMVLDSGGQYFYGTTDITRTLLIGEVEEHVRREYTAVLKGMINLSRAIFPKGTNGIQLDTLAREHLWRLGLNYNHGTGHGVGAFLGVHEGPPSISWRGKEPLEKGMILSNEPGFYRDNAYGIRIENLLLVEERTEFDSADVYLGFSTLTYVPIETRLVDSTMLTGEEKAWLNAYHREVFVRLEHALDSEERAWLKKATAPIS